MQPQILIKGILFQHIFHRFFSYLVLKLFYWTGPLFGAIWWEYKGQHSDDNDALHIKLTFTTTVSCFYKLKVTAIRITETVSSHNDVLKSHNSSTKSHLMTISFSLIYRFWFWFRLQLRLDVLISGVSRPLLATIISISPLV